MHVYVFYICISILYIIYTYSWKKDRSSRTEKLDFLLLAVDIKTDVSYLSRGYVTKYNVYYISRYLIADYSRCSLKWQLIGWVRKVIVGVLILWCELSSRYRASKLCCITWPFQLSHFMGCSKRWPLRYINLTQRVKISMWYILKHMLG